MIRLIIDSSCDLTHEEADKLGVLYLPLTISFGEDEYRESIDINKKDFYNRLENGSILPKTSQITPFVYEEAIQSVLDDGDIPFIITISSSLSGTYSSAFVASSQFEEDVYVLDSQSASIGLKILIQYAKQLIDRGCDNPKNLFKLLDEKKNNIGIYFLIDTLTYLQKGGRISKISSLTGNLLSIKPLMTFKGNEIKVLSKPRGFKKGHLVLKDTIDENGEIDYELPYSIAYSGNDINILEKYIEKYENIFNTDIRNIAITQIGSSIGTHLGPNSVGVAFFYK